MYFSAFPEEFSAMRFFYSFFLSPSSSTEDFGMYRPEASLLGVVGVQPRAVLLLLLPDDQEHLRHVLRQLFAEECAEGEKQEDKAWKSE